MKEKHSIKISLITVLLIIALIIIAIMGFYIYQMSKAETGISNTSNSNLQGENAEEMAKKTLDKYVDLKYYENSDVGPMPYILVELGLETEDNINLLTSKIDDTTTYIKSNTKYEDFKETLLQYVTENYFLEKFSQYKNIDGYVGFCNIVAGTISIEVESVTLDSIDGTQYTFNVTFKDLEAYEHYLNPENGESVTEEDCLFNTVVSFEYANNRLLISKW